MSKFVDSVLGYKTACGRTFEMLPDEKLAVDGVDLRTSISNSTIPYVMFVTTKRIILKMMNFDMQGGLKNGGIGHAEIRTINLEDVKSVKITKRPGYGMSGIIIHGQFKDFSVKEKTGEYDYVSGGISPGYGGLEYRTPDEMYQGLTRTFSALSGDYGFGVYWNGPNSGMSTMTKEEAHVKANEATANGVKNIVAVGVGFALLLAIPLGFAVANRGTTSTSSYTPTEQVQSPVIQSEVVNEVKLTPDPTGRYDYVATESKYEYTCFAASSEDADSESYGCDIEEPSPGDVYVTWSDNVKTYYEIWDDGTATIHVGDKSWNGTHEVVTFESKKYLLIISEEGSHSWLPVA